VRGGPQSSTSVSPNDDVVALVGPDAEIKPTEWAVALVDADGSPIALRGSVGACMIAAEEAGVHVVPIH
jgi:hypothetical protein